LAVPDQSRLDRNLEPGWRLQKVNALALRVGRARGVQALLPRAHSKRVGVVDDDLQHHAGAHLLAWRPHGEPTLTSSKYGTRKSVPGFSTALERVALEANRVEEGCQVGGFRRHRAETETENPHVSFSPLLGVEVKCQR
jgi:hypothetical protein